MLDLPTSTFNAYKLTHGREFCSITFFAFSRLCFHQVSEVSTVFAETANKLGIVRQF